MGRTSREVFGLVRKIHKRRYNDYRATAALHNIKLPEFKSVGDTGKDRLPDITEDQAKAFDKAIAEARERKMREKRKL